MNQTIYKMAGKNDPFARIPKDLLSDKRLSWKAKGILSYLCGKPDGWKMRVTDLVKHGTDGKAAVRSALNELRKFGYAEFVRDRSRAGVFSEGVWKISDSCIFHEPAKQPRSGFPHVDKPDVDNRYSSKKDCTKAEAVFKKKKTEESKETPFEKGASRFSEKEFPAVWKPISGTKDEQLRRIDPPLDYPSEQEFNDFLENELLDHIAMGKRGDLYQDLCASKWHQWKTRRWVPIQDWQKYITALNAKMEAATTGGF